AADAYVGDPITLAGTVLHEVAHMLGGNHGGLPGRMNCNTNNLTVLNYMYQRGLTTAAGALTVDLSRGAINAAHAADETEAALLETFGLGAGTAPYRFRWYAPRDNVAAKLGISAASLAPAKRHCADGSDGSGDPPVVRVTGSGVALSPFD